MAGEWWWPKHWYVTYWWKIELRARFGISWKSAARYVPPDGYGKDKGRGQVHAGQGLGYRGWKEQSDTEVGKLVTWRKPCQGSGLWDCNSRCMKSNWTTLMSTVAFCKVSLLSAHFFCLGQCFILHIFEQKDLLINTAFPTCTESMSMLLR